MLQCTRGTTSTSTVTKRPTARTTTSQWKVIGKLKWKCHKSLWNGLSWKFKMRRVRLTMAHRGVRDDIKKQEMRNKRWNKVITTQIETTTDIAKTSWGFLKKYDSRFFLSLGFYYNVYHHRTNLTLSCSQNFYSGDKAVTGKSSEVKLVD